MTARSSNIDALRGFAILYVFQYHIFSTTGGYEFLELPMFARDFLDYGWAGVDLFFVLSAYLLTGNLLKHIDSPNLVVSFYKRRALRILPLFWALLLVGFSLNSVWIARGGDSKVWLWEDHYPIWAYVLFLQNWFCGYNGFPVAHFYAPTWSLAVEEHFYVLLPLFVTRLKPKRLAALAISWILAAPLIRVALETGYNASAAYCWSIARIDSLGWGMLLALAPRLWPGVVGRFAGKKIMIAASLICVAIVFLAPVKRPNVPDVLFAITTMAFAAALATFAAVHGAPTAAPATPAFTRRVLAWAGQRCFSIYLLHMPMLGLIFLFFGKDAPTGWKPMGVVLIAVSGLLTLLLASLTYRFIEKPFIDLADSLAPFHDVRSTRASAAISAPAE